MPSVKKISKALSTKELKEKISTLGLDELEGTISSLCKERGFEHICTVIESLRSRKKLESVGMGLDAQTLLKLLDGPLATKNKHHWKLSPLLVGLQYREFSEMLMEATEEHLHILKQESVTEPVQHHLTVLTHDLRRRIEEVTKLLQQLESEIETLNIEKTSRNDIREYGHRISDLEELYYHLIEKINKILTIVWSANRVDLIEMLTVQKESCQRILTIGVGHPAKGNRKPTGLHSLLDERLSSVYGNPLDTADIEALSDDEPAVEALTKLGVWYLRDFWSLGLLPDIKHVDNMDLDMRKHTEEQRSLYREKLFQEALQKLENLGLVTVKDLKLNMIYSKKTLQKFIKENN